MFKKFNNKTLALVFGVLLVIVFVVQAINSKNSDRTFETDIIEVDSTKVTAIHIYPKAEEFKEIRLKQNDTGWQAEMDDITTQTDPNSVRQLLNSLLEIKPTRLVSRKKEKWDSYDVSDSTGTRIKVFEGDEVTLDIRIGRFAMKNNPQQQQNPYMQQNQGINGVTHFRLTEDEDVFVTEGFLAMVVNQKFSAWRNKQVIPVESENFTELTYTYPADSGFVLAKLMGNWTLEDGPADSTKVKGLLSRLNQLQHYEFASGFTPTQAPTYSLRIVGNNLPQPIQIDAYPWNGDIAIHSSLNPDSYFKGGFGKPGQLFDKLFPSKSSLQP